MALNAFMHFNSARGESKQDGYVGWVEIQGWDWDISAETSWIKGGGASVGKPNPGEMNFEHYYDSASPAIMAFICSGKSFDTVKLQMCKTTGKPKPEPFFLMTMTDAFITKVACSADDQGNVVQKVTMVFKQVEIDYKPQSGTPGSPGGLGAAINYKWNIPAGTSSGGG
jgi:type VI secretion system secreted protein Hcp